VAATGTGKTVMAALDYASQINGSVRPTLLFVAHRVEILNQALATFRHALRDPVFGELWVGGHVPEQFNHVFASIQTLGATTLKRLDPDHFHVVVVDEFHHAAADSWMRLLDHLAPIELLGLTATPERADGLSVLDRFDGRIAAELRLWDAIDQQRLVPFAYFGIADGTDLREVPWRRGHGYDVNGLSTVLTADDAIAHRVLAALRDHVADVQSIRALGFCVSVAHARFMARVFDKAGLAARAIWSDTKADERAAALRALASGEIRVLFSVDLFNEGVDVPTVDTLLMLRPTMSGTLFLQQLGRGLRHHPGKRLCTVLDFVGQHRREFRFDTRYGALLGGTRRHVHKQVEADFPFLPSGCDFSLDPVARDIVLRSLKNAVPSGWTARVRELARLADPAMSLGDFLDKSGLDLEEIYQGGNCWSDMREAAELTTAIAGPAEIPLRRAIGRLLHVDDESRCRRWRDWLSSPDTLVVDKLSVHDRRLLRMLVASLVDQAVDKQATLDDAWSLITTHTRVRHELIELLEILVTRQAHVQPSLDERSDVPLLINARYTRREILAACGIGDGAKVATWQTGVYRAKDIDADLLAFTLDKTDGDFSPTTRYRDYAISRTLVHWESQNVTREDSETGMRYQQHAKRGGAILLFARERSDDRAFWFLGTARYVSHTGERPMAITWRLDSALPGDLYAGFAAAVA
jgi:superfamily II DNA or RNA helicase